MRFSIIVNNIYLQLETFEVRLYFVILLQSDW